ncbi:reverse transcriptase family protein [Lonepinella sp. BR2357]|uniref:reverse transcriptase family protein n=1 Tax=Lonepinella sp. BR2357 TaxID=3434549 RepID=UPI003F6DB392
MFIQKAHSIQQSRLYAIKSLRQLSHVLGVDFVDLKKLINEKQNHFCGSICGNIFYSTERWFYKKLFTLLNRIEKPEYLHSSTKRRSYLTNVQIHINQPQVLRLDIQRFYENIDRRKIFKFFRNDLHCSHQVADYLADVCTFNDVLPFGCSSSMLLAFWANQEMFEQLHILAKEAGLRMTVYVDDITFSGKNITNKFKYDAIGLLLRSGYAVNKSKVKLYRGLSTPKYIAGLVVHQDKVDLPNGKYKVLHDKLTEWHDLRLNSQNCSNISRCYHSLMGYLSYVAQFSEKYNQIKKQVKSEFLTYQENELVCRIENTYETLSEYLLRTPAEDNKLIHKNWESLCEDFHQTELYECFAQDQMTVRRFYYKDKNKRIDVLKVQLKDLSQQLLKLNPRRAIWLKEKRIAFNQKVFEPFSLDDVP